MILVHTVCALVSYLAFLIASIASALFLIQERQLKRKTLGLLFHRLPPLERLDCLSFAAIGVGFALLSLGATCGFIEAAMVRGRWWSGDPKEWLTVALWSAYFLVLVMRWRATLRGHRIALFSIVGFGLVLLTLLGASWLRPSWHSYV